MLRYAWAYQAGGGGEFRAYPAQSIAARLDRQMPAVRLINDPVNARIARRMPVAQVNTGQLYIFSSR